MKVISFCSVKGGTGKSTLSLLTALVLKACGKRVLFLDLDPQNSSTFFFMDDTGPASIFLALMGSPIKDNIINTAFGVDLIPSDLRLLDCRTIETNRIKKLLSGLDYDFCVIDSAPTFDALTMNAYNVADIIVIPSTVDAFAWKTCHFLINKFEGMELQANVNIVLNLWKAPKETTKETAWSVREKNLFANDEILSHYILNESIPRSNSLRRVIAERGYKLKGKSLDPIKGLVYSLTGEQLTFDYIGGING